MLHNLSDQHETARMGRPDLLVKEAAPTGCFLPLFDPSSLSSPIPKPEELGPGYPSPPDPTTDPVGGGTDIDSGDVLFLFLSYSSGSEVTESANDGYCPKGSVGMFGVCLSLSISVRPSGGKYPLSTC